MSDHPFLQKVSTIFYYGIAWFFIAFFQVVVQSYYTKSDILLTITDSYLFHSLLAFEYLAIWYFMKYSQVGRPNIMKVFTGHILFLLLIAVITLTIWSISLRLLYPESFSIKYFIDIFLWRIISLKFFYILTALIYQLWLYYQSIEEKIKDQARLKEIIKETELSMLKDQINPHFLFNSLNSISSLTLTNPAKSQEMVIRLSDYMRYSLSKNSRAMASLKDEMEHITKYLEIEQVRFGQKLIFNNYITPEALNAKIPAMLLQPLFENAIKHGVYESTQSVTITTTAVIENDKLKISIVNNFDPDAQARKGAGIGLKNIQERLALIYSENNLMLVKKNHDTFQVNIEIPQNQKL